MKKWNEMKSNKINPVSIWRAKNEMLLAPAPCLYKSFVHFIYNAAAV